jgi:hypothetical protein
VFGLFELVAELIVGRATREEALMDRAADFLKGAGRAQGMLEKLGGIGGRVKAGGAGAFLERVLGVGWERNDKTHGGSSVSIISEELKLLK